MSYPRRALLLCARSLLGLFALAVVSSSSAMGSPTVLARAPRGAQVEQPWADITAQGNAIVTWEAESKNENPKTSLEHPVVLTREASVSSPGSAWQAPVVLSTPVAVAGSSGLPVNVQEESSASWGEQAGETDLVGDAAGSWQRVAVAEDAQLPVEADGGEVAIAATPESGEEDPNKIEVATRLAGASEWQAPVTLSSGYYRVREPSIAVGLGGEAVAVWVSAGIVQAALRTSASGAWTPQVALSGESEGARAPEVAVDARGDAIVAWKFSQPHEEFLQATVRPAATGQWGAPVVISEPYPSFATIGGYQLTVNAQDQAFAIWEQRIPASGEADDVLDVSSGSAPSGAWEAPVDLSALGPPEATPVPAEDALARPSVGPRWADREPGGGAGARDARAQKRRGPQICMLGKPPGNPQGDLGVKIAFDPEGDAIVVWTHHIGESSTVRSVVKPRSGGWQAPQNVSDTFPGSASAALQIDGQGDAIMTWTADGTVQAAVRSYSTGVWQTPVDLTGEDESVWGEPSLAANRSGEAVLAWQDKAATIDALRLTSTGPLSGPVSTAPVITSARITNTRFQAEREDAHYPTRAPVGTDIQFTLSQPAQVKVTIMGAQPGLLKDGQCLTQTTTRRGEQASERCTRAYTAATLFGNGSEGTIHFTGRATGQCRREALPADHYAAVLIATNPGGYSQSVTLPFTIIR